MYEHIEGSWVETDGEGHILDDTHPIKLTRRVKELEDEVKELREDLEEANQLGLVAHQLLCPAGVKNQQLKDEVASMATQRQQWKDECTMVTEALFRNYENQCSWQGQDPTDRENYYEEDYPEINALFDERYGYEESSDEDE